MARYNHELYIDGKYIPPQFYSEVEFVWEERPNYLMLGLTAYTPPERTVIVTFSNGNEVSYDNSRVKLNMEK